MQGEDDAIQANQIALEGVRSIKVVNAYSLQDDVCQRYSKVSSWDKNALRSLRYNSSNIYPFQATRDSVDTKIIHLAGVAYGFSQVRKYNRVNSSKSIYFHHNTFVASFTVCFILRNLPRVLVWCQGCS